MRIPKKWLAGTVAGALPLVLGQSAASAATDDHDSLSLTYTTTGGETITCQLDAYESVEDYGGGYVELQGQYTAVASSPAPGRCNGTVTAQVTATDDGESLLWAQVSDARNQTFVIPHSERQEVQVRWAVHFDGCASNCNAELVTKAK